MKYRYLTYPIDKHQSSPTFRDDFPEWLKENCDDGCDVVVDLELGLRYWMGEWATVDVAKQQPQSGPSGLPKGEMEL